MGRPSLQRRPVFLFARKGGESLFEALYPLGGRKAGDAAGAVPAVPQRLPPAGGGVRRWRCEEIYNDYNGNLVTLFWCVKNRPLALMTELNFLPLNSRQEFEVLRKFLREEEFTDAYLREELELCERFFLSPEREELR